jgi:excisionase family DNA binding protein
MKAKLRAVPNVSAPATLPPGVPQFLNVEEVAAMLQLEPRTIYNMVSQRRIPFRRAGRQLRFNPKEIDEWTKDTARR